jgi:tetratricopeptide (TPR) repeat protein
METPFALLKFIAKAALNVVGAGMAGELIVEGVPAIARDIWAWWGPERDEAARKAEVEALAQAAPSTLRKQAEQIVLEVAPERSPAERSRVAIYLSLLPGAVRHSLRRAEDPSGRTLPSGLALRKPEDLLPFLPTRVPRFQPGHRPAGIGDWELVELLGVGGFGEVWKARNPHLPDAAPVALKFCLDPTAARVLRNEAAILARVSKQGRHPGIVQLLHTYLGADPPCLEYEYVGGGDLAGAVYAALQHKGKLSPVVAGKVVYRLARIMTFAHRLNPPIVHRDLKPANVLMQKHADGTPHFRIADFGIGGVAAGQALEESRGSTSSSASPSMLRGSHTPLYASPQQRQGAAPDPRDDVHALGVIWYQLLIGDLTKGVPQGAGWMRRLAAQGIAQEAIDLLADCIEEDPDGRPRDAGVLAERLKVVLDAGNPTGDPVVTGVRKVEQPSGGSGLPGWLQPGTEGHTGSAVSQPQQPDREANRTTADVSTNQPRQAPGQAPDTVAGLSSADGQNHETAEQAGTQAPSPDQLFADAQAHQANGDHREALKLFKQALRAGYPEVEVCRCRAASHLARRDLDSALDDLSLVVQRERQSPAGYLERGRLFLTRNDPERAIGDFTTAIRLDVRNVDAYLGRGRAYEVRGAYDLALADYNEALRLAPERADILRIRARAHLLRGDHDRTLADCELALRLQPDCAQARYLQGKALQAKGDLDAALAAFIDAIRLDPNDAQAYCARGEVFAARGNDEQAISDFTQAVQIDRNLAHAYHQRGLAYLRRKNIGTAQWEFTSALRSEPKNVRYLLDRANCYLLRGKFGEAIHDCTKVLRLENGNLDAYRLRGICYAKSGSYGRAISDLTRVIAAGRGDAELLGLRAESLCERRRLEEATTNVTEALRLDPACAAALAARGCLYARRSEPEAALADLSEAIRLQPKEGRFYRHRAKLYQGLGRHKEAVADFGKAIRHLPPDAALHEKRARSYDKLGETDKAQADRDKAANLAREAAPETETEQAPRAADNEQPADAS